MFIKIKLIGTRKNKDFNEDEFSDPVLQKINGSPEIISEPVDAIINIANVENILTILPGVENKDSTSVELIDDAGEIVNYLFNYPFNEVVEKFKKVFPNFNIVEF